MKKAIAEAIGRLGGDVTVKSDLHPEGMTVRGVIEHASGKAAVEPRAEKIGRTDRSCWRIVLPFNGAEDGDLPRSVEWDGMDFSVLYLRPYTLCGERSHWEGLLRLKGRVEDDA